MSYTPPSRVRKRPTGVIIHIYLTIYIYTYSSRVSSHTHTSKYCYIMIIYRMLSFAKRNERVLKPLRTTQVIHDIIRSFAIQHSWFHCISLSLSLSHLASSELAGVSLALIIIHTYLSMNAIYMYIYIYQYISVSYHSSIIE